MKKATFSLLTLIIMVGQSVPNRNALTYGWRAEVRLGCHPFNIVMKRSYIIQLTGWL